MLRVQKVREGDDAIANSPLASVTPDFPQLWLPLQRTLMSIDVHSWLAKAPKSKNSVDTFQRIQLKEKSTSGTSDEN